MELQTKFFLLRLGFLSLYLSPSGPKKLNGYEFPVYKTEMCPRNETEWNQRSSAINCTKSNSYICIPNENRTELLEFCYIYPTTWINKGVCLYLIKRFSRVDSYNCRSFEYGCPNKTYKASQLISYPSCVSIGNGCFLAEQSCEREWTKSTIYLEQTTERTDIEIYPVKDNTFKTLLGTFICILLVFFIILYIFCRKRKCSKWCENTDVATGNREEHLAVSILDSSTCPQHTVAEEERVTPFENAVFENWQQENTNFVSTRACKCVESKLKNQNLVIVTGHSGSGKSAIIQNIALKYKDQGWVVKPLKSVQKMVKACLFHENLSTHCLFVLNDPIGKEVLDKNSYHFWKDCEEAINTFLKTVKLLISCRDFILFDYKVKGLFEEEASIVNIDDVQCKLTDEEKRCIWNKYMTNADLSVEGFAEVIQIETCFPLLCKLYSCDHKYRKNGYRFFKEPLEVYEEHIKCFRQFDREKYCALVLLVLFNNKFCVDDVIRDELSVKKFKHALTMCGLPHETPLYDIRDNLVLLERFFVKKIGDVYKFYDDFVMEVTSFVFGNDYEEELIKHANIGFLLRRVTLDSVTEQNRPFTLIISERHIDELGKRLFTAISEECFLEVILYPALSDKRVIKVLKKEFRRHPEKLQELIKTKRFSNDVQKLYRPITDLTISKLAFFALESEISPLCALVALCHTDLSFYCLQTIQQSKTLLIGKYLVSAVCCNGSKDFLAMFPYQYVKDSLSETFGGLFPIHITALFHNFEILEELINVGTDLNMKTKNEKSWTPLMFAATRDNTESKDDEYYNGSSNITRQDQTVQILIHNGADVNLCAADGISPLYLACQNGHVSMVEILVSKGAHINLCCKNGKSPLFLASQQGHHEIVNFLLEKGADINSITDEEVSSLFIACLYGHDSIVQKLIDHGADVNLCTRSGASPLFIACQKGYNSAVQILLRNGANVNRCKKSGASPLYIACQNNHDSTAQILLRNASDVNLCRNDKTSPLFISCENGNKILVQLLLDKGADINHCDEDGTSPLFTAYRKGHHGIVQVLVTKGANINACTFDGYSPFFIARQNRHEETVRALLE